MRDKSERRHVRLAVWVAAALVLGWGRCAQGQETRTEELDIPWDEAAAASSAAEPAAAPETPAKTEPPAAAQAGQTRRLREYSLPGLDAPLKLPQLTLKPMNIEELVGIIAAKGGLSNIVFGKNVSGQTTTARLEDLTVGEALEIVLSMNNLAYEIRGGVITIITDEDYIKKHGRSFYDNKKVRIVQLRYADASRVKAMLEVLKSAAGTVAADPGSGTLVLLDTPDKLDEMQTLIDRTDQPTSQRVLPTETRTFSLQYAAVEEVQPEITPMLTKEAGSMRVDKRNHTLVVSDLPHNLRKIEQVVEIFDKRPKQVFIEAKIVEVTLSDDFALGVNWNHLFEGLDPRFALRTVSEPQMPGQPVGRITYNTITGGGDLQVVVDALKKVGDTKILSNPQIAVLDGEEARIEVIEDQPYKEIQLETGTTNISGVTYQFKKVGVQLVVTPRVNDQKMISCKIKPEISSISAWYDGAPQQGTPVIKVSTAETRVMVQDNVTIIIGGMIKNTKSTSSQGIPWLRRMPLLGFLFRSDGDSSVNSETVVFLTPRVVSGEEPFLRMKDIKKRAKPLRAVAEVGGAGKELKAIR